MSESTADIDVIEVVNNAYERGYAAATNDLISQAIKVIDDLPDCSNGYSDTYDKACIIGVLEELSTVEVKKGKWIKMSDPYGVYWACSECGEELPRISHFSLKFDLSQRLESIDRTKYCPNCGIKMDEVEND